MAPRSDDSAPVGDSATGGWPMGSALPRAQPIDDRTVVIDGLRLHAIAAGEGHGGSREPVVLIHGFGVSTRYLRPLAARLAVAHPVSAIDLPGHGGSEDPPQPYDLDQHVAMLLEWLDVAGIGRCVLLGHSMGCQVAARLAARHPGRVARLILVSPTVDPRARGVWPLALRLARDLRFEPLGLIVMQARDYLRSGLVRNARTLRFVLADEIEEVLPRVAVPTLVVRGEHDPVATRDWCERVVALLPRGEMATIPRAGHGVPYSAPDDLAGVVLGFLASNG